MVKQRQFHDQLQERQNGGPFHSDTKLSGMLLRAPKEAMATARRLSAPSRTFWTSSLHSLPSSTLSESRLHSRLPLTTSIADVRNVPGSKNLWNVNCLRCIATDSVTRQCRGNSPPPIAVDGNSRGKADVMFCLWRRHRRA